MGALPASNVRPLIDNIDGTYVKITWDDPNPAGQSNDVRIYPPGSASQKLFTVDAAARIAFVPEGSWEMALRVVNTLSPRTAFTVGAQDPPLPPSPPTARQNLESVLGPLEVGSRVVVYPDPTAIKTIAADGTVA